MASNMEAATGGAIALNAGKNARQFQALFEVIPFTFTFEEDSLAAAGRVAHRDITVTGAALGDFVLVAPTIDSVNGNLFAFVQGANTVTVVLQTFEATDVITTFATATTCNGIILKPRDAAWGR